MTIMENVPDSVKVATATGSSVLSIFGIPVEQWMYIMSAIVSIMFIIEKAPVFLERLRQLYTWIRRRKKNACKE